MLYDLVDQVLKMDEFIECVSLLREGLGKLSCCEDLFELSYLVN